MTGQAPGDSALLESLCELVAASTGFDFEAVRPRAVERVLESLLATGATHAQIAEQCRRADPALIVALREVVVVGETFFFRQPEHFHFIATTFIPEHLAAHRGPLRAWSAGCATGEETYSLAATLLGSLPSSASLPIDVLGTDLLERNVESARRGTYALRSLRPSGPLLYPTFRNPAGRTLQVAPAVAAVTRFQVHNVLDPPPVPEEGRFHLVLCRNVLLYFSRRTNRIASRGLAASLVPGGVLVVGPMDLVETPPGLVRFGPPELQLFRRVSGSRSIRPPARRSHPPPAHPAVGAALSPEAQTQPAPPPPPPRPARAEPPPPEPVAVHLRALSHIERGEVQEAETILSKLCLLVPDYVPGLMEHAMLKMRAGRRREARELMEDILLRTGAMQPDRTIAGPEPLPARFYSDSARAFLERHV